MRLRPFSRLSSRMFLRLAAVAGLGCCAGVAAAQCTTTITGTVYSPKGPGVGDPIPNILVYVPQTAVLPFANQGTTGGCSAQANLVSGNPLVSATSDAAGNFTLVTNGIGGTGPQNIVIQAGKWRRQYPNTQITACAANNLNTILGTGGLTMPSSQAQGDLPRIAVVTGSADDVECIFHQIGIADTEVTDPTGTGSINLYSGASSAGSRVSANTPTEATLVASPTTLASYDVVIFGCQGGQGEINSVANPNTAVGKQDMQNMVDFANAGGRIFATHYGYVWLENIQPFENSATWLYGNEPAGSSQTGPVPALINTSSFPEGVLLAQWLKNVGALYNNIPNEIGLSNVRVDTSKVNIAQAQSWVNLINTAGNPSMQFTFDTPVGSQGVPTVAATFTNTTTRFQPGDTGDALSVNVTNNSTSPTTAGLTMTISMPGGLTATSLVDPAGVWACNATTLVCTAPVALAAGASATLNLTFNVSATQGVGQVSITAALSGGGISNTGQCGRVLYNDYHVEQAPLGGYYPATCGTSATLTSQEKFLEFSLYNLSNFVAPTTTDIIVIQGTPILTWATPAAIPFGSPLTATQLDATAAFQGTAVAGTYVYTPPAGTTTLPVGSNPATNTLSVVFTPTNTTNYTTATGSVVQTVVADTTTVVLTSGTNPSYLGQSVTFTAAISTNGAVAAGQTVNFFDGLTQIGSGTTDNTGAATYSTAALIVGTHNMTACVVASTNFNASCSPSLIQLVTLIPTPPLTTSTVLTSNANPAFVGQNVTFTVGVATTGAFYTVPAGTVTFYDGTVAIGTGTLSASGFTSFSTTSLTLGTHTITAVYGGSKTLATSTSNAVLELVLTSLPSAGTGFLFTVDPVNISLGVGTSQALNVQVLGLNNYQQTITLSCATKDTPVELGCNFGKTVMPVGGGLTTLTMSAAAPHACGASTPYFTASGGMKSAAPWMAAGFFGLLVMGRRRKLRRLAEGLTLALGLCVLPMLSGCASNCTDFGTQPATYYFTVTATPAGGTAPEQSVVVTVKVHL
jgi:hypothetical protein